MKHTWEAQIAGGIGIVLGLSMVVFLAGGWPMLFGSASHVAGSHLGRWGVAPVYAATAPGGPTVPSPAGGSVALPSSSTEPSDLSLATRSESDATAVAVSKPQQHPAPNSPPVQSAPASSNRGLPRRDHRGKR